MTTVGSLVERTRSYLMASRNDVLNVISVEADTTVSFGGLSALTFGYPIDGLAPGATVSLDAETCRVFDTNSATKTATVIGAQAGSFSTVHPVGTIARINPEFTDHQIIKAINDALMQMFSYGIYRVQVQEFTYNAAVVSYPLDQVDSGARVLEVSYDVPGPDRTWPILPRGSYAVKRNPSATDFGGSEALSLYRGGYPGRKVRALFAAPILAVSESDLTADVTTEGSGLNDFNVDVPCIGAAATLTGQQEIKRNLTGAQSDTRRAGEVPAGANLAAARYLEQQFRNRCITEAQRLQQQYPSRRRTR